MNSVLILKIDGTEEFQLFANENKIQSTIEKLLTDIETKYSLLIKRKENQISKEENIVRAKKIISKKLKDGRNFEIKNMKTFNSS